MPEKKTPSKSTKTKVEDPSKTSTVGDYLKANGGVRPSVTADVAKGFKISTRGEFLMAANRVEEATDDDE